FETAHAALALAGGLMRVLRSVIEPLMRAVFHPGQKVCFGSLVALELVGDEHARDVLQPLQQLAEKPFPSKFIPGRLDENIQRHCQLNVGSAEISPPSGRDISPARGFLARSGM